MTTSQIRSLQAFGRQIVADVVLALRDLGLLRAINDTLDWIDMESGRVRQLDLDAERFIQTFKSATAPITSDVDLVSLFDSARDAVGEAHAVLVTKHDAAMNDPELLDKDGIVDAYACLIDGVATLHNRLNTLSWIIGEHNADFDKPTGKAYTDVDAMFADMVA